MGDWVVLNRATLSGALHGENALCRSVGKDPGVGPCYRVVEAHQETLTPPPAPEFEISVSYWTSASGLDLGKFKNGWRYVLSWDSPTGDRKVESVYGFANKERAKAAAEYRADQVAASYNPAEKYTYTPGGSS